MKASFSLSFFFFFKKVWSTTLFSHFSFFFFFLKETDACAWEAVWDFSVADFKVSKSSLYAPFQLVFLTLASLTSSYSVWTWLLVPFQVSLNCVQHLVAQLQSETCVARCQKSKNERHVIQNCNTLLFGCPLVIPTWGAEVCSHTSAFNQQKLYLCDEKLILCDAGCQTSLTLSILTLNLLLGFANFLKIERKKN